MKIYVVTSGEYSQYQIHCVCSTKEKAEEAKRAYALGAGEEPEEYELDGLPLGPAGMNMYRVVMCRDGKTDRVFRVCNEDGVYEKLASFLGESEVMLRLSCWAKDERHAVKIANERRTVLLATGQWK